MSRAPTLVKAETETGSVCLGFDEVGLALVFAVLPFMGMLAKPLAGWLADRFSLQKTIFMASIVLSGTLKLLYTAGTLMLLYTVGTLMLLYRYLILFYR
jgi:MFS family permease